MSGTYDVLVGASSSDIMQRASVYVHGETIPPRELAKTTRAVDFDDHQGVSASVDGRRYREVARGTWPADRARKTARFRPTIARRLRLESLAAAGGVPPSASEIGCGGTNTRPRPLP